MQQLPAQEYQLHAFRHARYARDPQALTDTGWVKTLTLAYSLRDQKFDAIVASAQPRAIQTALILKYSLGIAAELQTAQEIEYVLGWINIMFKESYPKSTLAVTHQPVLESRIKDFTTKEYDPEYCEGLLIKGNDFKEICNAKDNVSVDYLSPMSYRDLSQNSPDFANAALKSFQKVSKNSATLDTDLIKEFDYDGLFKLIQQPFGFQTISNIRQL